MNLRQKISNDKILQFINSNFDNEVYLVGGAVRDYLLEKETFDRDLIVCDEDARIFALKLAEKLCATFVPLDEVNKIYRLVLPDKVNYIDITNPVENSLKKDLLRRDLTINAIAVNIKTSEVLDITGGINDFNNKLIKIISEQNVFDDPLRILRVFRFHSNLGFDIDKKSLEFVLENADLIRKPAVERVNYEIMKMFQGQYVHETLLIMNNLLEILMPFVSELKKVPPNSHHHLDLFNHSVETVKQISELYKNSSEIVKEHLNAVDFGGFSRLAHLKLAAFMHDIGKFSTWTINDGRHRFIKHDDVGSKMSVEILKNMHFSNKQIEYISFLIKNHIYPSSVVSAPDLNEKVMMRFVRKAESSAIDVIMLAMADRLSARGPEITEEIVDNNIRNLSYLLDFYLEKKDTLEPLPKLLDGNEVMDILNIKPSPLLGEILDALHEAQISGDILSRDDAVNFVQNYKIY